MNKRAPQRPPASRPVAGLRAGKPCPVCGRPAAPDTHPFCSTRCADVDLHRWLGGTYVVAAEASEPDEGPVDDGED